MRPLPPGAGLLLAALWAGAPAAQQPTPARNQATPQFDHAKHRKLFPACETCHLGALEAGASLWPAPASCATCHDGTIQPRVAWAPPAERDRTNQRFDHSPSADVKVVPAQCVDCHAEKGAPWMTVERVSLKRCLDCHEIKTAHLAAPDTACAICHLPLVRAVRLTREDIAGFPKPPSHEDPGFVRGTGHGAAAKRIAPVTPSCSVCHAQNFCLTCHVDAPEQGPIQALPSDPRATAIAVRLEPPPSHADESFLARHGAAGEPGRWCDASGPHGTGTTSPALMRSGRQRTQRRAPAATCGRTASSVTARMPLGPRATTRPGSWPAIPLLRMGARRRAATATTQGASAPAVTPRRASEPQQGRCAPATMTPRASSSPATAGRRARASRHA